METFRDEVAGRCCTVSSQIVYNENKKVGVQHDEMKGSATVDDWWQALRAVVGAMKAFRNSESVQSYGTYALGCMLKVFTEAVHFHSRAEQSGQRIAKQDLSVLTSKWNRYGFH